MTQQKEPERSGDGNGKPARATPGVMGGAALVGAGVGAVVSGPFAAIALAAGAAGLCLRDDKVGQNISWEVTRMQTT